MIRPAAIIGPLLFVAFGEAEELVVRAVEHCWNSWKTRFDVFHSFNSFHQPVLVCFGLEDGGSRGEGCNHGLDSGSAKAVNRESASTSAGV